MSRNAKATHIFFSKIISVYAIFNDQSFNDTITNDIFSFEQLGPGDKIGNRTLFFLGLTVHRCHTCPKISTSLSDFLVCLC